MNPVLDFIGGLIKPVTDLIDDQTFSGEEKAKINQVMMSMQANMTLKVLEYETKLMEHQASVIKAEASSGNWLTAAWRPIVMLGFFAMVVSWWLGYTPEKVTEELVKELFSLIKLGLGGYIIGRSAEKTLPAVARMFKKQPE